MIFIRTILLYLSLVALLSSCSSRYYLKRAQANLRKAESLGAQVKTDTVYVEKTVLVPEVKVDTIVHSLVGDTVLIEKEKLRIKYVKLPGDSVYVEGKCDPDTIRLSVPYAVTKDISVPAKGWLRWWHIIIAFLVGAGTYALFKK